MLVYSDLQSAGIGNIVTTINMIVGISKYKIMIPPLKSPIKFGEKYYETFKFAR